MALSNKVLIFEIILPTIFGIAAIAIPLILFVFKRKKKSSTGTLEETKEAFIEAIHESGLAQPIPSEKIKEQIEDYEKKLAQRELEREGERLERAEVLSVRGTERLDAKNFEGAIKDLEDAIEILPEGSEAWASANFNLGFALIEFPRGDRETNLRKAIESYKNYLSLYTKDRDAVRYAGTQNNMGVAYWGLSEVRDREKNLKKAIEAYEQALIVRTFKKFPQGYAMTQNNLGNAYADVAEVRDREENLKKAIEAYKEALKVRKKETLPIPFAETSYNLAIALTIKGDTKDAIKVTKEILPVAEMSGDPSLEQYQGFYERLKSSQ